MAVSRDRIELVILRNGQIFRIAVDRRCARKNQPANTVALHRVQKAQRTDEIIVIVQGREPRRLGDGGASREMDDGLNHVTPEYRVNFCRIVQAADNQLAGLDGLAVTLAQIIINPDSVPKLLEASDG